MRELLNTASANTSSRECIAVRVFCHYQYGYAARVYSANLITQGATIGSMIISRNKYGYQ